MAGDDDGAGRVVARASLKRVADWVARDDPAAPGHWLGRFVVLRLLGLVYLMAFLTLVNQGPGADRRARPAARGRFPRRGRRPARRARRRVLGDADAVLAAARGDGAHRRASGWVGVALSLLVLAGYANALVLAVLCALQISVVDVGQDFYAFGWEIQLVETGFLCIFLCPLLDGRPFPRRPPPAARRLAAALAGHAHHVGRRPHQAARRPLLARPHLPRLPLRDAADPQPAHAARSTPCRTWAHELGVLFNHVVELARAVPGVRRRGALRLVGGALMAALQLVLIASGNLSFLNWLTLVPILACFDDGLWRRVLPRALVARAERRARPPRSPSRAQGAAVAALARRGRAAQRRPGR